MFGKKIRDKIFNLMRRNPVCANTCVYFYFKSRLFSAMLRPALSCSHCTVTVRKMNFSMNSDP